MGGGGGVGSAGDRVGGGGVRADVNREVMFLWGVGSEGGGRVWGGQDGCERRIEVLGKIIIIFFLGGSGRVGSGGRVFGVRVDVNRELKFL